MPVRTPRTKILRRLGTALPGLTRKSPGGRTNPPGQHGAATSRRRTSSYRRSLEEKQKVRFNYGVTERQMLRYLARARAMSGATGGNLLEFLERRLDSVVFRLGLAPTIPAARQLVSHGHVRVDGARVDRPAYEVSPGDSVTLAAGAPRAPRPAMRLPSFLAWDAPSETGRVLALPARSDASVLVDESLIIAYYTR